MTAPMGRYGNRSRVLARPHRPRGPEGPGNRPVTVGWAVRPDGRAWAGTIVHAYSVSSCALLRKYRKPYAWPLKR